MRPGPPFPPDWRDPAGYAALLGAGADSFAWEWLRRDLAYRDAARAAGRPAPRGESGDGLRVIAGDPEAARWGLHAFENPDLPASAARPIWRSEVFPRTLVVTAWKQGAAEDRFDIRRFATLAVLVRSEGGEHLLLGDGRTSLRLDIAAGSLLEGPVRLAYELGGLAGIEGPLATLSGLVRLCRSGRLGQPAVRSRNRRRVLLLRAFDALEAGARQREIAQVLLSAEAARARWRTEVPSLRLQSQRLVGGARAMARGGYLSLLRG
ncbi:DNA -binding domain-containing protein [Altererythrobacter sp. Root672]|uniref:DNA -binding domain-containing protein n=1 Tax=Altererythrobacter sp. Root672 TaxID=1736584 RepID=UPI0006F225B7|nr:DUF2285 domain-containing protein [Altererythrobacter sp. Root672]KRA84098.1 hypothetical protein ASD76_08905 [Altererythrobacter sp. Root672]